MANRVLDVANGLLILAKYEGGYSICAEHDEISAGPDVLGGSGTKISDEDKDELLRLGWFVSDEHGHYMIFV